MKFCLFGVLLAASTEAFVPLRNRLSSRHSMVPRFNDAQTEEPAVETSGPAETAVAVIEAKESKQAVSDFPKKPVELAAMLTDAELDAEYERFRTMAEKLPGVSGPFGYFDPLSFGMGTPEKIKKWTEAEIKHGRLAMLASVGYLVQEFFHPLQPDAPARALTQWQYIEDKWPQFDEIVLVVIGLIEGYTIAKGWQSPDEHSGGFFAANLKSSYEPGDLGFDPLNLLPKDAEGRKSMMTKERNNGRLAMLAIIGMWLQEIAKPDVTLFG
uniref:Plastid light harvesting protein n=1 Tax=Chromera velia CCMP2878 TaxID=1169474 RepID=A0A0G4HNN3_9ALVE|eukprot:Cvel_29604.t1-p1 / transcript=Cvel_29604.t1 / gene=Cvel_29604 / organism=Chromera_velia_CCMP2878 / gene_product=Chlorophyll a-b binding protein L1818,, putative / transcript_product=Chlorophyll a-b binding protein L1818,, putative / location=Cvel_scaffold4079:7670-9358(-) / protein_length=268 / sequence_SO=supercontig / SO=protein_coding / is_pseudo=false